MRHAAVAKRNRELDTVGSEHFRKAVAASALQQSLLAAEKKRRRENAPKVYRSKAAGLKLKQALRSVDVKGIPLMQRETTRSAVKRFHRSDRGEIRDLLRKIAGEEPDLEANDLEALAKLDRAKNPTRHLDTTLGSLHTSAATAGSSNASSRS